MTTVAASVLVAAATLAPVQPVAADPGETTVESVVSTGDTWSYFDHGTDPGPDWHQPGYDDTTWQTGNGQFGYGDGDEATIIDYGPDPRNKHATTYFRKTINIDNAHQLVAATASLTYDDGAIIYLNGTQIHHTGNIPTNHTHQTWANQNREETIPLTINPNLLNNGQNTIAVEIHQAWRRSNDISFDLTLTTERNDDPKPPLVEDDQAQTDQGVPTGGDLGDNDDPGLRYDFDVVVDPTVGQFALAADGAWSFTPAPDFLGTVPVAHRGCDADGVCAEADLMIVVDELGDVSWQSLIDLGDTWSYFDHGTDPGPDWHQPGYDDTTWQTGNGQFGYGDGDETTIIDYGPDPRNKHATTYFRKVFEVGDAFELTETTASLTYDDGAIIYLNGTQIHHTGNIPTNHTHQTWANQNREETIPLTINPNLLNNGQNTIAVEIHQAWRRSNDISFDLTLEARRLSLPGPPAPTVVDDRAVTPPEVAVSGSVAINDRANDDRAVQWSVAAADEPGEVEGSLSFSPDGAYSFTPAPGFGGTVEVPYSACNGPACARGRLDIVVIDGDPAVPGLAAVTNPGPTTILAGQDVDIDLGVTGPDARLIVQGLPDGLTTTAEGRIVGRSTGAGEYPVRAYVIVDRDQSHAVASFLLSVDGGSLVSRSLGLDGDLLLLHPGPIDLMVGQETTVVLDFQVSDGTFGYRWLAPGLTATVDGRILGTPTDAGSWTAEVWLQDLTDDRAEIQVPITVRAGAPGGLPSEHPALDVTALSTRPMSGQHGVIGVNPNDSTVADVRVWDMQQAGPHMYVGGEFQQVQTGQGGAIIEQRFLARFDVASGQFDPDFRPVLDGNVHALELSPQGLLLVGGEFTSVDGLANTAAVAAIDPSSGQVVQSFRTSMERPWSANEPIVRELEVVGQHLYIAGHFSHVRDRATMKRERVYKLARVDADSGEADLTWRPKVNGSSVYGIGIDQDRGRVLLSGGFSSVDGAAGTAKLAIVDTVAGNVIDHTMPATAWKVFDVEYANDLIFVANSWNNQITVHDADSFELLHQYESDGDFQSIEKIGDHIYAGCHCTQDPAYPTARILDARTGQEVDLRFDIGGNVDGAWSVAGDDRGCAWVGGDIKDGGFDTGTVWARGFARFCADGPAAPPL